jgi:large subunit ribosomal protein L6
MSRIGKNPIVVPAGVTVEVAEGIITVKGKKGQLTQEFSDVTVKVEGDHTGDAAVVPVSMHKQQLLEETELRNSIVAGI